MPNSPPLQNKYTWARCCCPGPNDAITGYFSFDDKIKVHRADCANLAKTDQSRLMALEWHDVLKTEVSLVETDIDDLDDTDFAILQHHRDYDIDYSLKVARMLHIDKELVFERHRKLRTMDLLKRVEPLIVQYRKGVVDNKWIKHRNHTYYQLTTKGLAYLEHRSEHD